MKSVTNTEYFYTKSLIFSTLGRGFGLRGINHVFVTSDECKTGAHDFILVTHTLAIWNTAKDFDRFAQQKLSGGFAVVAKSPSLHEVLHVLQNPFWQKASKVLLNSVGLDQCSRPHVTTGFRQISV